MSSNRFYASIASGSTMESSIATLSSSRSSPISYLSSKATSPDTTFFIDSNGSPDKICLLNCEQLAILKRPYQLFSAQKHGGIPYTINSKMWYHENYKPVECYRSGLFITTKRHGDIWNDVYGAAGVVYGIAKVFVALCRTFYVDLHTQAGNILTYIEKAERDLKNGLVVDFIFAIEDLYFSLYARLEIEIALLHFCSSFMSNGHLRGSKRNSILPDLNHIYTILTVCKNVLLEEDVCSAFDERLVRYHQRQFVEEMNRKYKMDGTLPLDYMGYRAHVYEKVEDPSSYTYRHWCQMYPELQNLSIDILAFLSEKYVSMYPRMAHNQIGFTFETPEFKYTTMGNCALWDENMIAAHRLCSLARIEGKAVGELRRGAAISNLLRYAREQKCICIDICTCSSFCTKSGSRLCPCSRRWTRGITMLQSELYGKFQEKSTILGELTYESLAALKQDLPDDIVRRELLGGISVIREEMIKERLTSQQAETDVF